MQETYRIPESVQAQFDFATCVAFVALPNDLGFSGAQPPHITLARDAHAGRAGQAYCWQNSR